MDSIIQPSNNRAQTIKGLLNRLGFQNVAILMGPATLKRYSHRKCTCIGVLLGQKASCYNKVTKINEVTPRGRGVKGVEGTVNNIKNNIVLSKVTTHRKKAFESFVLYLKAILGFHVT